MRWLTNTCRLTHISTVLIKHRLLSYNRSYNSSYNSARSLRLALESLGPLFVKFGQLLSTRKDLLSSDMAEELAKLQDKVAPFPGKLAREMIEQSLQQSIDCAFQSFEEAPLASASVAQVHKATLHDGQEVVIKVLRPKIHAQVKRDVALLETLAKWIHVFIPASRRLRLTEVVQEFKTILFDELDLMKEAANTSQLRRNFKDSESLYVPEVYWEWTRTNVLVLEQIHGIPISDIQTLKEKNVDLKCLAERGVEIFFTQVFRDCFFHADMHPGNIFVSPENPSNPKYIAVDCGIMGTLSPEDQRYLGENFLAFFKRDYRRVAELHVQSGWVPPSTRVEVFEAAIRTVCEPIFEKPLKDISFGQTLMGLFQTARRFDMQVQPQLVLLQKTLLSIEGLGRQLYPDLDLWQTAKPYLETWMKKQFGPRALLRNLKAKIPTWNDRVPNIPEAIFDILHRFQNESNAFKNKRDPDLENKIQRQARQKQYRQVMGFLFLAVGSCVALMNLPVEPLYQWVQKHPWWIMCWCVWTGLFLLSKS